MSDIPDLNVQPMPTKVEGAVSSHDLMVADLHAWGHPEFTFEAVVVTLGRKDYGLRKYEEVLHRDNDRDHPKDAEDEAVDKAAYLRTWIDQAMGAGDFGTAEWLWPLYQQSLWHFAVIAHYRATGVQLPALTQTRSWPPSVHPDLEPYRQEQDPNDPDAYRLIRPGDE